MKLSPDQASACEQIRTWVKHQGEVGLDRWDGSTADILTFGAFAGCGKTTIVGVLAAEFQKQGMLVAYATFTGRASTILARKLEDQGVATSNRLLSKVPLRTGHPMERFFLRRGDERLPFCGTLHRLLYAPMIDQETEELLGWNTRANLDRKYNLLVVDEASQVGDRMLKDLAAHGVPILAVGDHGQLSPIKDTGDLMKNPQVRLEKIHRQAENSAIIRLSMTIRETGRFDRSLAGDEVVFGSRKDLGEVYKAATQARLNDELPSLNYRGADTLDVGAMCWTNKTRVSSNRIIRKALGFSGPPKENEPMVCLKNYDDVFNGMRGVVQQDAVEHGFKLDVEIDFPNEEIRDTFEICGYQLFRERTFGDVAELKRLVPSIRKMSDAGRLFDMAYCMTVHKMQGSAWRHAILIVDRPVSSDEETRRFFYTSITRASHRLTVLT